MTALLRSANFIIWLAAMSVSSAADWPMYARDRYRSNTTDEPLSFPLRRAWTYHNAQPPRPAWPEPVKVLNSFDFDYAFQPVVAGGLVYFGSSADDTVRALDAASGAEKWHFIAGGPVRFAPQIAGGKVYFSADDGVIYCLDAATGKIGWTFNAAPADERLIGNERMISRWPARTGVLVDGGVLYCTAGMWPADGIFVYALDAASGKVIWCNDTSGLIFDVRTLHMGADFATYGVCPQGALLANDELLLVPTGKALPAGFDRKTGKLLYYRIDADVNTQGGTWVTIDGNKFHTTPYICSFSIDTGRQAGGFGGGAIPVYSKRIPNKAYSTYEKVSAIVTGGKAYARKAHGMALAGTALVIGMDGSVTAESTAPRTAVDLRFGLAGDDLAVQARVGDRRVVQHTSKPWDGSCVELFGAMPGQAPIGQVFLIPGAKTAPSIAFRSQDGKVVPAPEIRVKSTTTAKGYELSALIPLSQLALDKANPDVRLEAQVTIPGPDGTLQRGTLFGSVTAHQNSAKFGTFRFKPQGALASPEQVQAALTGVKPVAITMGESSELWRAEVDGEARGLAVANGRLFVSTSKGNLYCFVPSNAAGVASAVIYKAPNIPAAPAPDEKTAKVMAQLKEAGIDRGYALVIGDAQGSLATALARLSRLHVITILPDEKAVAALREKLLATTALYGSAVHVQIAPRPDALPFAQYFANAVVVAGSVPGLSAAELYRVLRPCGGLLLCPGLDAVAARKLIEEVKAMETHERSAFNEKGGALSPERNATHSVVGGPGAPTPSKDERPRLGGEPFLSSDGATPGFSRGRLPGALDWDSTYALDQRVKWPLRLLWFGGPGPALVLDRKQLGNIGPAANGRFFVNGPKTLSAVDAYNGTVLWSRPLPADPSLADDVHLVADAERIKGRGMRVSADGSNVYLTLSGYFGTNGSACVQLDARTGEQKKIYGPYAVPPQISLASPQTWPLEIDAAHAGAVTLQQDAEGLLLKLTTKDPAVTKLDRWDLYFDFRPAETRYGLYDRGAFSLSVFPADGTAPASWKKGNGEIIPAVTLEGMREAGSTMTTVRLSWAELVRLTGGKPASFGFGVRLNACDNVDKDHVAQRYLFCDLAANGLNNGWANVVLGADGGTTTAPAILVGPYASLPKLPLPKGYNPVWGSQSVAQMPRRHPLTGAITPKVFQTGSMGCGGPAYSAFAIFTRSTAIGIYDFADDSGTRTFDGVKPGCATTMTAAQGLLLSVEGRGGCTCTFNYQTSLALAPVVKRGNEDWALYFDLDTDSRITSAALNLGAPGDRRADDGTLWLSFPRIAKGTGGPSLPPNSPAIGIDRRAVVGNLRVPLTVETFPDGGTYRFNADRVVFGGTDRPWLYATGYRGIRKATLKLDFGTTLVSVATAQPPVLDGKANDALWAGATLRSGPAAAGPRPSFAHRSDGLREGGSTSQTQAVLPTAKADVFLRHDGEQLYLLARRPAVLSPKGYPLPWIGDAPKPGPKDDQSFYNDCCWEVFLGDARSGRVMHLRIMPTGARFDALAESAAANENVKWNGVWTSAVVADTNGFTVEMAIPWKTLADAGLDKDSLGINVMANGPLRQSEALRFLGMRGRQHCENFIPLAFGQPPSMSAPRAYTVRLHFAEPDNIGPGRRMFNVKLQGQTILKNFDIVKEAGAPRKALVKEFKGVPATETLTLEFVPAAPVSKPENEPLLCALELVEEKVAGK